MHTPPLVHISVCTIAHFLTFEICFAGNGFCRFDEWTFEAEVHFEFSVMDFIDTDHIFS